MDLISELRALIDSLATHTEITVEPARLAEEARNLSNDDLLAVMTDASKLKNNVELLTVVFAGLAAERSTRENGNSGFAQIHGHHSPMSFVQSITGMTRADVTKHFRASETLLEGSAPTHGEDPQGVLPTPGDDTPSAAPAVPIAHWHDPLRQSLLAGVLTLAQHDAIRRGLGEPPLPVTSGSVTVEEAELLAHERDVIIEVWRLAAEQLITEAAGRTVEELIRTARQIRDQLDPEGCARRFEERYQARSFRMWIDANGIHQAKFSLDDEAAAWFHTVMNSALRPRRGGPRFVTNEERATAQTLIEDPRTNDQLAYDLIIDTLKAGALADAETVFGARQPGVRIIATQPNTEHRDAFGRLTGTGHLEDGGDTLPGHVVDRTLCTVGSQKITIDPLGNPLNVGREQRLFTAKQRIALAARDGGCLFPECDRVASYTESHHIDHFVEHEGRTDIDRGILLCRFHHMLLHNRGWRITRDGLGPFILHRPHDEGAPIALRSRSPYRWQWDASPPRTPWKAPAPLNCSITDGYTQPARIEQRA